MRHGEAGAIRAEIAAVVRLALPVILIQVGMMLMSAVDAMMLGRVSELALAAGALGSSLSFGMLYPLIGVLMAVDPLVAQAYGAGDADGVAAHTQRGMVLAVVFTVPISLLMWDLESVLLLAGQQADVAAATAGYMRATIPGNLAFLLYAVLRQSLQAMSVVRPALLAIVVANLGNVVADYALIFGHFGLPALGVVGSALATSLNRWLMLVALVVQLGPYARRYRRGFHRAGLSLREFARPLRIGLPIGFQTSFEIWLFMAVALMMGSLGARQLAGHQIAISIIALVYMVPLGIGGAAATRVGNAIGARSMAAARRSAAVCLGLGAAVMTLAVLSFVLVPRQLARIYTPDADVIAMAAILLPIAAIFQVVDGLQVVASGALRGAADTRVPAQLALVGFWLLGLPLAYVLAFPAGLGPAGLWWGLTGGLGTVAILLLLRLRRRFAGDIEVVSGG